jgi:hypothetical protein
MAFMSGAAHNKHKHGPPAGPCAPSEVDLARAFDVLALCQHAGAVTRLGVRTWLGLRGRV